MAFPLAGVMAIGADRTELVANFKEALNYHLKQNFTYKIPEHPSLKIKAKDHIRAVAEEMRKNYGDDEVLKVNLISFSFRNLATLMPQTVRLNV